MILLAGVGIDHPVDYFPLLQLFVWFFWHLMPFLEKKIVYVENVKKHETKRYKAQKSHFSKKL